MSSHSFARQSASTIFLSLLLLINGCYLFSMNKVNIPPEFPELSKIRSLGDVDFELTMYTLNGEEKAFKDFENKVIFLTVWATWCDACLSILPGVQRLYDLMSGENVSFLLLSAEDESTLQEFVETSGLTVPVNTYKNVLPVQLKTEETPTTFIINRRGSIVFKHIGAAKWDDLTTRKFLRELQQWR